MTKCAFCTRDADSGEHIFSEWMVKLLPPDVQWQVRDRIESGEYVTYQKKKINLRAKVVCQLCNNRWMSVLESDHVKPAVGELLLGNKTATFHAKEIAAISTFAFKTTVVANHRKLREPPFFASADRFRFRKSLTIPDGVQVWIACRKSIHYNGMWVSKLGKLDRKHRLGFRYYTCTWNFQNFVLQTLCGKWEDKRRRKSVSFPPLAQHDHWNNASVQIWPPTGNSIDWPPPLYIGDDTFKAFSDRWNTITFDHVNMRFSTPI
jgi:hypothetical protein